MRFSTEWIDEGPNASAEERATLCDFRIFVNEENACLHFDPHSNKAFDHVTVPAVHLAEGLATDWWSIFGGRDREHPILHYRTGFALPKLSFKFDGSTFEVTGTQLSSDNPNLRFLQVGTESLSRDAAESTLSNFIEGVVEKLVCSGVANSEVAVCWSHVSASRNDPEERAFCEAAGALGVDPYLISDADAQFIEEAGNLFSGEALIEFLAGIRARPRTEALNLLAWVRQSEDRRREESRLPDLPEIARQIGDSIKPKDDERSWATGYRAARALRAAIAKEAGEGFTSTGIIAGKLGAPGFTPTPDIPGVLALLARDQEDVHVHLRRRGSEGWAPQAENFAFARAIGDAVCFPDTPRSVVNDLHDAERQAAGRAFAAEFLAPVESVLDMAANGRDDYEIAGSFNVSTKVVDHQIENQDRIRQSCASLAA